jgi:hypothetical protein
MMNKWEKLSDYIQQIEFLFVIVKYITGKKENNIGMPILYDKKKYNRILFWHRG